MLLRAVPKCVCPSCGMSTTVSPHVGTPPGERASCSRWSFAGPGADPQLRCWSRPTAGMLGQMLCSPSLGVSVSGFSSGWCSTFLQITCRHGQSLTTLHFPSPRASPEPYACQVSGSSQCEKESFSGHRAVCNCGMCIVALKKHRL